MVKFTHAVYKFLLGQECTLDDLKIEDPSLYKCVPLIFSVICYIRDLVYRTGIDFSLLYMSAAGQ